MNANPTFTPYHTHTKSIIISNGNPYSSKTIILAQKRQSKIKKKGKNNNKEKKKSSVTKIKPKQQQQQQKLSWNYHRNHSKYYTIKNKKYSRFLSIMSNKVVTFVTNLLLINK